VQKHFSRRISFLLLQIMIIYKAETNN